MRSRKLRLSVILFLGAFLGVLPSRAQSTAEVRGKVTDASHKPVVSAFVIITGAETSMMRAATTDDTGTFQFPSLPVGTYHIEVKADGFPDFEAGDIRASIGQVKQLAIVLSEKAGSASAQPAGSSGVVEAGNAQLGVVMNDLEVTELPLKSRDTFELLQLQPGVQSTVGVNLFFEGSKPGVIAVNGGRARSNNYNVNGGAAGEQMVNFPSLQPSPDSISEFRVISHNYDAALGRNSGSVLNVVTKSGSHRFHGSAYEFLRNNALNSKGYFDLTTPDFKQNEFGGTFGGPIRQGKTFFFSSYEGRRFTQGITSQPVAVPTSQERGGDFSAGTTFIGKIQDAFVATTLSNRPGCAAAVALAGGLPIAAGTSYAAIFPGNVIPTQCFDPTAADLMQQFVPAGTNGVFQASPNASGRADQGTFRLDHNLTSQQQLSFYYYFSDDSGHRPFADLQDLGANLPGFGDQTKERFQQLNASHTWAINAKTSNELRLVFYRGAQGKLLAPARTNPVQDSCATVPADQCFSDPSNPRLGIHPGYGGQTEGVPLISLSGGFTIGNNGSGTFRQDGNIYQGIDNYGKVIGNHTLKFGTDIRRQQFNQLYLYAINGTFQFTGGGPNDVGYTDLVPNYLLGLPDSFNEGSGNSVDALTTQFHVYAQDAWKLRPNLTLNYGLRWEWNTPQYDSQNRVQAFRPGQATKMFSCSLTASNPINGYVDPLQAVYGSSDCSPTGPANAIFPLGLVFPGDTGVPQGLTNNYLHAFAPRLGLAWAPSATDGWLARIVGGPGKTSVRMGWGMFYDSNEELLFGGDFAAQPPYGGSTVFSNVFFNTPFLNQNGSINPNPYNGPLNPSRGSAVDFALFRPIVLYGNFPNTLRNQYSEHYHVTVQREVLRSVLVQLGYVGSQGHRLLASMDQNYGNAQTCLDLNQIPGMSCGPYGADSAYYIPAGAIPAGVTLHLPYGSVSSVTGPNANPITLVGLRKYSSPYCEPTTSVGCPADGIPVFGSIFGIEPVANSSYNAFQALLRKSLSGGLQLLAAYTWSKSMDNASSFENSVNPIDPRKSRSLSLYDARHRLSVSAYWQIPRVALNNWAEHVVNGWSLSSIATLQSGFPIRITATGDNELMNSTDFEVVGEPNQVAPLRILNPRTSGGYYFDPTSFVAAPLGQIGNTPRTVCCGPGIVNFDVGIQKNIRVREGSNLEFRTELFNIFNHTQFLNPAGDFGVPATFGQVQKARDPRLVQMALRWTF
ncbi:MAG: TonB-dependent receptor [Acidobacteriia bacterium]|nr:TonB-dependent receptor [Terriglobia bacterium]